MRRCIITLLAVAVLAAQEKQDKEARPVETGPRVQKIFQVKYANVENLWAVFSGIAKVQVNQSLRVLAVDGTPTAVAAIEEALKRLDVPPPPAQNVELIFHMILAKPAKDGSLPSDLASVQRNLESLFGFKGFQLTETVVLRARDGQNVEAHGAAPNPNPNVSEKLDFGLRANPSVAAAAGGNVIRIDNLQLNLAIPYMSGGALQRRNARFNTQIDVKEGQKVVVGKANVDGSDGAMILVVTAKVVE
jgi:hypothetical protein